MIQDLRQGTVILYDTEWTSWPGFMESRWQQPGRYPEIIQIGAVKLDIAQNFKEVEAFQRFIIPKFNPTLSDYIIDLTGITQEKIDNEGVSFSEALNDYLAFIRNGQSSLMCYGRDGDTIRRNCELNDIDTPDIFHTEIDFRQALVDLKLVKQSHMSSDLPSLFGLPDDERAHDALGDSRGLAKTLRHLRETDRI